MNWSIRYSNENDDPSHDITYRLNQLRDAIDSRDANKLSEAHGSLMRLHRFAAFPGDDKSNWLIIPDGSQNADVQNHHLALSQVHGDMFAEYRHGGPTQKQLNYSNRLLNSSSKMLTNNQSQRIGAYGLAIDRNKVLLSRGTANPFSDQRVWWLPGGGIDEGESQEQALRREVGEETGLNVRGTKYMKTYQELRPMLSGSSRLNVRHVHLMQVDPGEITQEQGGSTDLVDWMPLDNLPLLAPFAKDALSIALRNK